MDTYTETLRQQLRSVLGITDNHADISMRRVAKETGISASTLSRFCRGRPLHSNHVDVLTKWLKDAALAEEKAE
jgi:Transcriptional regulators